MVVAYGRTSLFPCKDEDDVGEVQGRKALLLHHSRKNEEEEEEEGNIQKVSSSQNKEEGRKPLLHHP